MPGAGVTPGPGPGALLGRSGWPRAGQGRRPMTHAGVVDDVLFWLVVGMVLLLVMFIYAVITAPPPGAPPAEPPAPDWPALEPPGPAAALPARRPLAPASPDGAAGASGGA